jgi:magnesium transporter
VIHIRIRRKDGSILKDAPLEELGAMIVEPGVIAWLDVEAPSFDELHLLGGILGWSELTLEDLEHQGQRAKIERFDTYTVLVMHDIDFLPAPGKDPTPRLSTPEVDFIIGANYVASIHYHPLEHIGEMRTLDARLGDTLARGPDMLLYNLIDRIVDGYFPVLDDMHEAVEDLEQEIIANPKRSLLTRIFEMKHDSVLLRRVVSPQLEVFTLLMSESFGIVRQENVIYFRDVHDHLYRVFESTDTYRDLMSDTLSAYLSTVNNRLSEVMKTLTVISSVLLPLTLFSGMMGMNLNNVPPWNDVDFWLITLGMLGFSGAMLLYFRFKGWF